MIRNLLRLTRPEYAPADKDGGMFGLPGDVETPKLAPAAAPATPGTADPGVPGHSAPAPAAPATPQGPKAEPKSPETPPAQTPPSPEAKKPDAAAPKTPEVDAERAKQRAAYFQQKYQANLKELTALQKKYAALAAPGPEPKMDEPKGPEVDPDEMRERLRDPLAVIEEMGKASERAVNAALAKKEAADRKKALEEAFETEKKETVDAWHRMICQTDDNGNILFDQEGNALLAYPEKVLHLANERVQRYGIDPKKPGGPTAYLAALMDNIHYLMSQETGIAAAAEQEAKMAAKVKTNMMAVTPPPIGTVTPGDKSPEQKRLDELATRRPVGMSDLPT